MQPQPQLGDASRGGRREGWEAPKRSTEPIARIFPESGSRYPSRVELRPLAFQRALSVLFHPLWHYTLPGWSAQLTGWSSPRVDRPRAPRRAPRGPSCSGILRSGAHGWPTAKRLSAGPGLRGYLRSSAPTTSAFSGDFAATSWSPRATGALGAGQGYPRQLLQFMQDLTRENSGTIKVKTGRQWRASETCCQTGHHQPTGDITLRLAGRGGRFGRARSTWCSGMTPGVGSNSIATLLGSTQVVSMAAT